MCHNKLFHKFKLNSDVQNEIEDASHLTHDTHIDLSQFNLNVTDVSNTASYASNTIDNLSNTVYSVSLKAHLAYDNELAFSETINNVSTSYWLKKKC